MGEHDKIIVENYPADKLPEELRLRLGLEAGTLVTLTVEPEQTPPSLKSVIELFGKVGLAHNDPVADIRKLRDEWND